ncbi:Glu/Leu/Phe/Val dehydrogenase dimerization domain-containing protein [Streptomyces sp. JV176]|uniref:Glu/Leu/Phe/Val dehydrogenase dimerization domain-containing protein n=1 Tax=Streptomyces sp. JV176 TaxID=858630 RepID=UPI002E7A5C26|nr:Glu/Leu/Phe/Val dehydrogenase dimerization domain-containing protein [Streptomyces sp. JV176]MEE1799000.1 Glu/Leu/Phe/Val dehydrogenase dimerization domain-containing protein [Streptomyces sp. JV176]
MTTTHQLAKVFHWRDDRTEAEGWLVIDSLVGGVSGGGLFMHPDVTLSEVADLASTMTLKNTLQRPRFGGGKGGIRYDPASPEAEGVLRRFMLAHREVIARDWSTGADLYTSRDVIERIAREDLALPTAFAAMAATLARHAGIASQAPAMPRRLARPWNEHATVDDAATGHSVAEAIRLSAGGTPRVAVQGFGSVGSNAAYSLTSRGIGQVTAVCEKDGYLLDPDGIDIPELLRRRAGRADRPAFGDLVGENPLPGWKWVPRGAGRSDEALLTEFAAAAGADVLTPCATRYALTDRVLREFVNGGGHVVVCGANNAFATAEVKTRWIRHGLTIVPEWVSNSGAAILFAELLKTEQADRDTLESIFSTITERIEEFLHTHGLHVDNRKRKKTDAAEQQGT